MKKLVLTILTATSLLFTPALVFAVDQPLLDCSKNPGLTTCQASNLNISQALATVIQFLFVIAVILALGFLIYGGIRWITSGGDKTGVETARNTIVASIIGLIIVFLAYVIINLVLTFLTGGDISKITIPSLGACKISDAGLLKRNAIPPVALSDDNDCAPGNPDAKPAVTCVLSNGSCVIKS